MAKFKDLDQLAATPIEVDIEGKVYTITPLTLEDLGKVKSRIKAQALLAYDEYLGMLAGDKKPSRTEVLAQRGRILRDAVSELEQLQWLNSLEGMQYLYWLSAKKASPELTLAEVEKWMQNPETLDRLTSVLADITYFAEADDDEDADESAEGNATYSPKSTDSPTPNGSQTSRE